MRPPSLAGFDVEVIFEHITLSVSEWAIPYLYLVLPPPTLTPFYLLE